jgi:rhodanese-related sulfurtransferase
LFPPPVPSVDPDRIPADAVLVDVREPDEWQSGHVRGAIHIPLAELPARTAEIPGEGDLVVICRSGVRSARAVAWLNQNGHDAVNCDGGMVAWAASGREMVSETGEAPTVR